MIYNTEILESNLCHYNYAYMLAKDHISNIITAVHNHSTSAALKISAPFDKYIIKCDGTTIDDAEELELVVPMYNLIEYSLNYSDTTGSL